MRLTYACIREIKMKDTNGIQINEDNVKDSRRSGSSGKILLVLLCFLGRKWGKFENRGNLRINVKIENIKPGSEYIIT